MSKLSRREFKELLVEWDDILNHDLLLEISKNEVIEAMGENGEDDYNTLVTLNKKASQDQNFLKVIINTYKAKENHTIEDILGLYQNYTRFIAPSWNKREKADVDVPGGYRSSLTPDSTTYDDILKFIDAAQSMILKTKVYIECLNQGTVNPDFEVIIDDSEWVICYPKTIKGSISLARSFWNGSELEYDKTVSSGVGKYIGYMNWCTSAVSGGNMFLNYHRKKNLHMYYCIKKNMKVSDIDRKLCISFAKENGEVSLELGSASVDGNNNNTNEDDFRSYIGNNRFDTLFKDAEKPERLEIDQQAYYESISLKQYKLLRATNENNLEDFIPELEEILEYSRDRKKIILLAAIDKNADIRLNAARHQDLLKVDPSKELIKNLASDEDLYVRSEIAMREDLLQADSSGNIIKQLVQDKSEKVRLMIAMRSDLLQANPNGDIIKQLVNDESALVRSEIARNSDLLKLDPSGDIIKQLVNHKNSTMIYEAVFENQDLSIIDPTGDYFYIIILQRNKFALNIARNASLSKLRNSHKILEQLVKDENLNVRKAIASRSDLLKLDPNGNIVKQLAKDESVGIRWTLALRSDLLKFDPSGDIIKQLAKDKDEMVKRSINRNYDLSKLNMNEVLLRSYIINKLR